MNRNNKSEKFCVFCKHDIHDIDYKDTRLLNKFINIYKKILPRRRTGTCSLHQRQIAEAVKRARVMALLPYLRR